MNILQIEILVVTILTACAAIVPGTFLVLHGSSLMSDAISHAILPGIVVMFFLVKTLHSPFLILGAALSGVLTVGATQWIIRTQRLKKDAAIGLVFPLFFSVGVILISLYARDVHLDTDMVLLGELAFAPFNRFVIAGHDLGPLGAWIMGSLLLINALFVFLFYKELVVSVFDKDFATVIGARPTFLYYILMLLTSITCVGAFEVVGSLVIVALMIVPAAAARLVVPRMSHLLATALLIGVGVSVCGYALASVADVSIAGSLATTAGGFFILALLFR